MQRNRGFGSDARARLIPGTKKGGRANGPPKSFDFYAPILMDHQAPTVPSWYTDADAAKWPKHPAIVLIDAIGIDRRNVPLRAIFHKQYEGSENGRTWKAWQNFNDSRWESVLSNQNDQGRRIYFAPNGGQKWDEVAASGRLGCHFSEWDASHNFTVENYLETDWSTWAKGAGFLPPSAGLFSGNQSAHSYLFLKEPYESWGRWYINQLRLNAVLGADAAVCDLSRVMRLPGFYNTHADGSKGQKSLLLFCDAERRYSIEELEAALLKAEKATGTTDVFELIPKGMLRNCKRRSELIKGLVEIYGPSADDEFNDYLNATKTFSTKTGDARPLEEVQRAFEYLPPFVLGQNTYQGEAPVTTKEGKEVHLNYFRVLQGFTAAFTASGRSKEEVVEFVHNQWDHLDLSWVTGQIMGGNGSIQDRSFWWAVRECGFPLSNTTKSKANADGEGEEDRETAIRRLMQELYEASGAYEDTWERRQAIQYQLTVQNGISKETIDRRLIAMLSQEFGFSTGDANTTERKAMPAATPSMPAEELIPGVLDLGHVAVFNGGYGARKTTAATLMGHAVISGLQLPISPWPVTKTGRVLFIASDGGEGAMETVKRYSARLGYPIEPLGDKFQFFAANRGEKQVSWSFCFRDLKRLVETLERYKNDPEPMRLVVIDSLRCIMDLAGIDSGIGPMGEVMRLFVDIAAAYNVAILLLHHTQKGNDQVAAGHASINEIAESVHFLTRTGMTQQGEAVTDWWIKKHRNAQERHIFMSFQADKGMVVAPGDTDEDIRKALLMEMIEEHDDGSSARNLTSYLAHLSVKEFRVKLLLAEMRREGLVSTKKGRWFMEPKAVQQVLGWRSLDDIREERANAEAGLIHKPRGKAEDAPDNPDHNVQSAMRGMERKRLEEEHETKARAKQKAELEAYGDELEERRRKELEESREAVEEEYVSPGIEEDKAALMRAEERLTAMKQMQLAKSEEHFHSGINSPEAQPPSEAVPQSA